ncbi:hypothetical protein [uncultured Megasphaera sp.]|uniref:hypothetical protein n=1 Tax=uncultured Megasphaera sp. TaxID=165188 RepID=UPI00265A7B43|nr:hypothetical protein [uncultured Megasphaera sp.]
MLLHIIHMLHHMHHRTHHLDEFEKQLYIITMGLFALLFIRTLVALYMGRWNLF